MVPTQSNVFAALLLVLSACGTSLQQNGDTAGDTAENPVRPGVPRPDTDADTDTDTDTDTDADSDTDTDADTDADTDTDTDTDTDADTDTDPGTTTPTRFIALGDAGTGSEDQYMVADAIAAVCERNGCDFALHLGDNIYSSGSDSVEDEAWQERFELPYSAVDFPFYAVLGNHDWGDNGGGYEPDRANTQVEYTNYSDKWKMPATFYSHVQGNATFIGLDTTSLDWARTEDQAAWLPGVLAGADTTWKIAYGHHPYISNGSHGNANDNFGPFFEDNLCGQVDFYLAGHDHHLEWLEPACGTEFVISGAAAKLYDVGGDNPTYFLESQLGFLWVEIDGRTITGVFYDENGDELYRRSFSK